MSEDSSGSNSNNNPLTYVIIPLVAILSIGFIATVLYCRRRRHIRNGDSSSTSAALDYPYPDWTQDRLMAAEGNLLHYPGGRHLSAFTASASAANSIEAARRANAFRTNNDNPLGFGGFGRPARHARRDNNNNERSGSRQLPLPLWSFWGGMRSNEGLNELGEAPPPYDTKRNTRSGSNLSSSNNPESDAERGNAGIDGGGVADGDNNNHNNEDGDDNNEDTANRHHGMEFSTRPGRRRRRHNNSNNNDQENGSPSPSRTPCRCRSQTRESFESAMAMQDWLIPRVTDMNAGAMPPEYVARPDPVVTAGPRGQPDFPAGQGPSRL